MFHDQICHVRIQRQDLSRSDWRLRTTSLIALGDGVVGPATASKIALTFAFVAAAH